MRVFLSAGEASGDALGAALLNEIRQKAPMVQAFGMGGPRMVEAGLDRWKGSEEVAVFGLVEVLSHLPRLFALVGELADRAVAAKPDIAVLVDVPDFHVRLAKKLTRAGVPVVCYVGPSVWAWRKGRVSRYAPHMQRLLVLFPFELPPWREKGVDVVCVGHPLADEIPRPRPESESSPKVVAMLPGSRRGEITRILPVMLDAAARLVASKDAERFLLPVAPGLDRSWVEAFVAPHAAAPHVELVDGTTPGARRDAIARSAVAMLASGTISLEVALLGRPQVVTYRVHPLTWAMARPLIQVPHVSLANLVAGREVAPELLQGALTAEALAQETRVLMHGEGRRRAIEAAIEVRARLGDHGAARRAAEAVFEVVQRNNLRLSPGV